MPAASCSVERKGSRPSKSEELILSFSAARSLSPCEDRIATRMSASGGIVATEVVVTLHLLAKCNGKGKTINGYLRRFEDREVGERLDRRSRIAWWNGTLYNGQLSRGIYLGI